MCMYNQFVLALYYYNIFLLKQTVLSKTAVKGKRRKQRIRRRRKKGCGGRGRGQRIPKLRGEE